MFTKLFWKGLVVVLPVSISIAVLFWITTKIEGLLGGFFKSIIGESFYFAGLGILLSFIVIILVGSLLSNYITQKLIQSFLDLFSKIPFLRTIYGPLKDLIYLFGSDEAKSKMKRVVWVEFDPNSGKRLGLVTRDEFSDLNLGDLEEYIAVYIPLSYMFGGYTTLVHRSKVKEADIPVEKALKLAITGWIKVSDTTASEDL